MPPKKGQYANPDSKEAACRAAFAQMDDPENVSALRVLKAAQARLHNLGRDPKDLVIHDVYNARSKMRMVVGPLTKEKVQAYIAARDPAAGPAPAAQRVTPPPPAARRVMPAAWPTGEHAAALRLAALLVQACGSESGAHDAVDAAAPIVAALGAAQA